MTKSFRYVTYRFLDGFTKTFRTQYGYVNQAEIYKLVINHGKIVRMTVAPN